MIMRYIVLGFIFAFSLSASVHAQSISSNAPIDISADGQMKWDRPNKTFSIEGNAEAVQGDLRLTAQKISAQYSDANDPGSIKTLTATTGVIITAPPYIIYADQAVYDTETQIIELTGSALRIEAPDGVLTAEERITFDRLQNVMTAKGNATIKQQEQQLTAPEIKARFNLNVQQKIQLSEVKASGGVRLQTENTRATAQSGVYDATTAIATLSGDVTVTQGSNILNGSQATLNITTGISTLTGGAADNNRVKATFFPKKKSS